MARTACVSEADLRALLLGELPEPLARSVALHLESCADCEEAAKRLDELTDEFVLALRRVVPHSRGNGGPAAGADRNTAPAHIVPPRRVADYQLLDELGRGGMSVVYKARQAHPDRLVALKVILAGPHTNPQRRARFLAEADAIARLQHPQIVQIYEAGQHDGLPFLSLEFMKGGSLARRLGGLPQPPREAAALLEGLARAVDYAHAQGVVHRDLNPANVLLTEEGRPKLADFGLAKFADQGLTTSGTILGTPAYMAPEQALGDNRAVGPAADIYALGAMLYELLTGRPPFQGATPLDTLEQVVTQEPVSPVSLQGKLPRDLSTICLKCLQKDPGHRYETALELADELARFLRHEPIHARPLGGLARGLRWARRNPALSALGGVAALALAAVLVVSLSFAVFQSRAAVDLRAALADAQGRRRQADRLAADLACERGLALCGQAEIDHGLLWLARSLVLADEAGDAQLGHAARVNLAGWSGRLNRPRAALGHEDRVSVAAFSPDGAVIATGSEDRTARLWAAATGEPIGPALVHQSPLRSLAFSPDGSALLTVESNGGASLWRRPPRGEGPMHRVALDRAGPITAAAFSPDGRRILTGGSDGTARTWSTETGREDGVVLRHGSPVTRVAFSPDGARAVTLAEDQTARLWEIATGMPLGSAGPTTALAFSPESTRLLIGGPAGAPAKLWDAATGRLAALPFQPGGTVNAVAFSPDGQWAVAACNDWRARVWRIDSRTREEPRELVLRHEAPVTSAAFSPDGTLVLTGCRDGYARVWDAAAGEIIGTPMAQRGEIETVAFSPDGTAVLTAGLTPTAWAWDLVSRPPPPESLPGPPWPYAMTFSPDHALLAWGGDDGVVRLWDLAARRPGGPELRHPAPVRSLAFGPGGKTLWSACDDGNVRRWDVASGQPGGRPLRHPRGPLTLAVSPDGTRVVTGTSDGTVALWDASTGTRLAEQQRHQGRVTAAAFSTDGRLVLTGGADHTAQFWDAATLAPRHEPLAHEGMVLSVAFRSDGRRVLTGGTDRAARLWDVATGAMAGPPFGDQSPIRTVAFSPDGQTAFLGGIELHSRLWDLATRKPLGTPLMHPGVRALDVAFDRSGTTAWVAGDELKLLSCSLPPSRDEPTEQVVLWVQVATGLRLGRDGEYLTLAPREWRLARRRLAATRSTGLP